MTKNKSILLVLKAAFVGGSIWYLLHGGYFTADTLRNLLRPSNLDSLLIAAALFMLCQYFAALRLRRLAALVDYHYALGALFRLTMIGNFFSFVLPGQVGGDLVKGYVLAQGKSERKGDVWGITVTDRALGLLALAVISGISMLYLAFFFEGQNRSSGMRTTLWVIGAALLLGPLVIPIALKPGSYLYRQVVRLVSGKLDDSGVHHLLYTVYAYVRKARHLGPALIYSVLIQLLGLLAIWVLTGMASVQPEQLLPVVAVSSVVILLGAIPVTPGNLGWTELLASLSWTAIGSHAGGEVFLFWRAVTVLCSLPGGILYIAVREPVAVVDGGEQR